MSQSVFNAYHSLTEEHEVAESSYSVRRLPMLHESRLTILRLKVKSMTPYNAHAWSAWTNTIFKVVGNNFSELKIAESSHYMRTLLRGTSTLRGIHF